ncbi:hypothetical protein TNCV_3465781 [Trichonephila clavipes]|nr:hypothetical protein TNCV_3465781 [Trichonephila clavipes]
MVDRMTIHFDVKETTYGPLITPEMLKKIPVKRSLLSPTPIRRQFVGLHVKGAIELNTERDPLEKDLVCCGENSLRELRIEHYGN